VYGLWRSLVSALVWGTKGPGFKSRQPDSERAGQRRCGRPSLAPNRWQAGKMSTVCQRKARSHSARPHGPATRRGGAGRSASVSSSSWSSESNCHARPMVNRSPSRRPCGRSRTSTSTQERGARAAPAQRVAGMSMHATEDHLRRPAPRNTVRPGDWSRDRWTRRRTAVLWGVGPTARPSRRRQDHPSNRTSSRNHQERPSAHLASRVQHRRARRQRTTTRCARSRQPRGPEKHDALRPRTPALDRHVTYVVATFVAGASRW